MQFNKDRQSLLVRLMIRLVYICPGARLFIFGFAEPSAVASTR